jgi:hypothetical protein
VQTYDTADLEYIPLLIKTPSYLPRHMHTGSTPFCQVRVLDNRFDTVVLYSKGSWPYRPKRYTLGRSTGAVIQQYLEQEIASMKKTGNKTLLIVWQNTHTSRGPWSKVDMFISRWTILK